MTQTEYPNAVPLRYRPPVLSPNDKRIATVGLREDLKVEVPETRAVVMSRTAYGFHGPNWIDHFNDSMEMELQRTRPVGGLLMDNFNVDAVVRYIRLSAAFGIEPYLIIRIYFNPNSGTGAGAIGAYESKAVERFRNLLARPEIRALAERGKLWSKILNETNIGTEGFPRGREGFAQAQDVWLRIVRRLRIEFGPLIKHGTIAMTPGNADTYFLGDAQNVQYAFHGPQGANPTVLEHVLRKVSDPAYTIPATVASQINAARTSRVLDPMFREGDGFFFHCYAQNYAQTRGDLRTWYAVRPKVFQFWLGDYNKPHFIPEYDIGYDEPANYGPLFVYAMVNYVDTDPRIVMVNRWWMWRPGEGDPAWTKHGSRDEGGNLRPHMHSIVAYRDAAPDPDPDIPPTDPNPPPTTLPPRELDPRLPQLGVTIEEARPTEGAIFWRVEKIRWEDEQQAQGRHAIYLDMLDENGARIVGAKALVRWADGSQELTMELKPGEPFGTDFPMYRPGCSYSLEGLGIPSDKVKCLGLGTIEERWRSTHVAYWITLRKRKMNQTTVPSPSLVVRQTADSKVEIPLNPGAALQKEIFRLGFVPNSLEFDLPIFWQGVANVPFRWQRAENLSTGKVMVFGAKIGAWDRVYWTDGQLDILPVPGTTEPPLS